VSTIVNARVTASHRGEIVVFIIGMRINRWLAIGKWWPVLRAMGAMLRELREDADSGFLVVETAFKGLRQPVLIQYWRSFEDLERYARDAARLHRPAWAAFNRAIGGDGSVGIYHETYVVRAGDHESIYANMPPFGLGAVSGVEPAIGRRNTARDRLAD
jgi:hypothetical protein